MQATTRHALRGPYRRLVEQYDTYPVIDVSDDFRFTRTEAIADLGCANWIAFRKLAKSLKKLKLKTARQLFTAGPEPLVKLDGIGTVTVYVAMCILDHHGYDVTEWWGWEEREKTRARRPRHEVEQAMKEAHA